MNPIDADEMLALLTPAKMSPEEVELRGWIAHCKPILEGRGAQEVAAMAILCGFPRGLVYAVLVNFSDAWDGTHIDNRAAFMKFQSEAALREFQALKDNLDKPKPFDLSPLWRRVHEFQTGEAA